MSGLLFIRHAQTDMAGTFCGHSDPPINALGRQQTVSLIGRLSGYAFNAICSSDLRRAIDTAEPLAATVELPVVAKPALREIHFGEWEGLTWDEIEQCDAVYARRWIKAFPALPAPGGESCAAFERRVLDEVDSLFSLAKYEHIAVVTHGGVMRVVLRAFLGCSEQQAWSITKPYCSSFAYAGVVMCPGAGR